MSEVILSSANSSRRIRAADLRVDPESRPGWEIGENRVPPKGERVYCTEGEAEVSRVCGRTSDGNRILELKILERVAPPFYAAGSNVLVQTGAGRKNGTSRRLVKRRRNGDAG